MNTDDLVIATRRSAFIGDATAFLDYTDAIVVSELNDKLSTVFEDIVVKARAGYWLHELIYTTIANDSRYRIPPRSVVGGLEKVEMSTGPITGPYYKLDEIPASIAQDYRGTSPGDPYVFTVQGDVIDLIPTPTAGAFLKLSYYARPSRLVTQQSSTLNGGTVRGLITAINPGTRVATVNVIPFDQSLAVPAAITSGLQLIDIVHPDGWHELPLLGATQTFSGLNITVGGSDSLSDVQVGDFVRVADQTDWPCLPDDFHRCLADVAAIKILIEQSLDEKAAMLAENSGNDLIRFKSLLEPRVKAEPKVIGIMRRSRGLGGYTNRIA